MNERAAPLARHTSVAVKVGDVTVGGGAPIVVQSMTNTDTADIAGTVAQVAALSRAGSELVRITVDRDEAAAAVPHIKEKLLKMGMNVPIVGDFHYIGHKLLADHPACAEALDKYRINPGNVGFKDKRDKQFSAIVETAIKHNKPVRIGANWGSLDQELLTHLMDENAKLAVPKEVRAVTREAMVQSALLSAARAEDIGLPRNKIILSVERPVDALDLGEKRVLDGVERQHRPARRAGQASRDAALAAGRHAVDQHQPLRRSASAGRAASAAPITPASSPSSAGLDAGFVPGLRRLDARQRGDRRLAEAAAEHHDLGIEHGDQTVDGGAQRPGPGLQDVRRDQIAPCRGGRAGRRPWSSRRRPGLGDVAAERGAGTDGFDAAAPAADAAQALRVDADMAKLPGSAIGAHQAAAFEDRAADACADRQHHDVRRATRGAASLPRRPAPWSSHCR